MLKNLNQFKNVLTVLMISGWIYGHMHINDLVPFLLPKSENSAL